MTIKNSLEKLVFSKSPELNSSSDEIQFSMVLNVTKCKRRAIFVTGRAG
jgi:hypothetical protein